MLAILAMPILVAPPVLAVLPQPDITPTISMLHWNRNLISDNDSLCYFRYYLPYSTTPDIPASETFLFRLMNGANVLGIMMPSPYHDSGYNYGVAVLYFEADDNLAWGSTNYTLQIYQNPPYFQTPVNYNTNIIAGDYTSYTGQDENRQDLAMHLYDIGISLESSFGKTLFQLVGGQQVLTAEGETYFRGAIQGLQAMCPSLFLVQQIPVEDIEAGYITTQFDVYAARFEGTWVGESENATAQEMMGMTDTNLAMALIITIPLALLAIIFSAMKFRRAEPGYVVAAVLLVMSTLMGWMPAAIFASIYQVAAIYTAYLLFYARG